MILAKVPRSGRMEKSQINCFNSQAKCHLGHLIAHKILQKFPYLTNSLALIITKIATKRLKTHCILLKYVL